MHSSYCTGVPYVAALAALLAVVKAGALTDEDYKQAKLGNFPKDPGPSQEHYHHEEEHPERHELEGKLLFRKKHKLFEGDIDLGGHDIREYEKQKVSEAPEGTSRGATRTLQYRWDKNTVPIGITDAWNAKTRRNREKRSVVAAAIMEIEKKTSNCIRFVPYKEQKNYIYIEERDGCYSHIGMIGGKQTLSLGTNCVLFGTVLHELMHALGFFHEHTRPDRDQYIEIYEGNIHNATLRNFEKHEFEGVDTSKTPYDLRSIMHYSRVAFAIDSKYPTIGVKPPNSHVEIGQREKLSEIDVKELKIIYECDKRKPKPIQPSQPKVIPTQPSNPAGGLTYTCTEDLSNLCGKYVGWDSCTNATRPYYREFREVCGGSCSRHQECIKSSELGLCGIRGHYNYMKELCSCACVDKYHRTYGG